MQNKTFVSILGLLICLHTCCSSDASLEIVEPVPSTQRSEPGDLTIRALGNAEEILFGGKRVSPNQNGEFVTQHPVTEGLNVIAAKEPCCDKTLAVRSWHQGTFASPSTWIEEAFVLRLTETDVATTFHHQLRKQLEGGPIQSGGLCVKLGHVSGLISLTTGELHLSLDFTEASLGTDCINFPTPLNSISIELTYEFVGTELQLTSSMCSAYFCNQITPPIDNIVQETFASLVSALSSTIPLDGPVLLGVETRPYRFEATSNELVTTFAVKVQGALVPENLGVLLGSVSTPPLEDTSTICPTPNFFNAILTTMWGAQAFDKIDYSKDDLQVLGFDRLPGLYSELDALGINLHLPPLFAVRDDGLWFDIGGASITILAGGRSSVATTAFRVPVRFRVTDALTPALELDQEREFDVIALAIEEDWGADIDSSLAIVAQVGQTLVKDYLSTVPLPPAIDSQHHLAELFPLFRFNSPTLGSACFNLEIESTRSTSK